MTATEIITILTGLGSVAAVIIGVIVTAYIRIRKSDNTDGREEQKFLNAQHKEWAKEMQTEIKVMKTEGEKLRRAHIDIAIEAAKLKAKNEQLTERLDEISEWHNDLLAKHQKCEEESETMRERITCLEREVENLKGE